MELTPHGIETWYKLVPKGQLENLQFRHDLLKRAVARSNKRSGILRDQLWLACRQDILFWLNAFVWTFDPRKVGASIGDTGARQPFISYPYQDDVLRMFRGCLDGGRDVVIEKSRDMGATWLCCAFFLWRWSFYDNQSFLIVSRKEQLVDGTKDSMFGHIDFMIRHMPSFLLPPAGRWRRNKLKLANDAADSFIEGESTTENIGRGGRRTAMMIDEFAAYENGGWPVLDATADTTECRIFNSTPNGTQNAFFTMRERAGDLGSLLRLHWSRHPHKAAGLYRPGRVPEIVDVAWHARYQHEHKKEYKYRYDVPRSLEKVRSPWYDAQCDRRAGPHEIATQLDIDYRGSAAPFFPDDLIEELIATTGKPPSRVGLLEFPGNHRAAWKWQDEPFGNVKLWVELDDMLMPPAGEYVIGIDVAYGTGMSYSVASVVNRLTGEKVAELSTNRLSINDFARMCVGLAYLFGAAGRGAYIIWEGTGPGHTFRQEVCDSIGFANVFYMTDEVGQAHAVSDKPGWYSSKEARNNLLSQYKEALHTRRFVNPSIEALRAASGYIFDADGSIRHQASKYMKGLSDASATGFNHGDHVIADALACKVLPVNMVRKKAEDEKPLTPLAYGWRMRQRRLAESYEAERIY
jgi:hypothetical protein